MASHFEVNTIKSLFIFHRSHRIKPSPWINKRLALFTTLVVCFTHTVTSSEEDLLPIKPVLLIREVSILCPDTYRALIAEMNDTMRTQYGVPLFYRAYEAWPTNNYHNDSFSLSPSNNFENLLDTHSQFSADPRLENLRTRLATSVREGPGTYLKAIRFDGTHTPGWLFNTLVKAKAETDVFQQVEYLEQLLTTIELSSPKINVFRVVAGKSAFSHLVSINLASQKELGIYMDCLDSADWSELRTGKSITEYEVVGSNIFRELLP